MAWLLVLLLPAALFAQFEFGPVRLDDSLDYGFACPAINQLPDGSLECTWSSWSDARYAALGQVMSPSGEMLGERETYAEVLRITGDECAPVAQVIYLPDHRSAQVILYG